MNWKISLAAVAVGVGGAYIFMANGRSPAILPSIGVPAPTSTTAGDATALTAHHGHDHDVAHNHDAPAQPMPRAIVPLNAQARAVLQQFDQLRNMVPGDAAVALGRQLEAGITTENAAGYVQALLKADTPAVERSAMAALAHTADSGQLLALAGEYSVLPPENRGRILQTLESAANPAAVEGLTSIVAADKTEKRSALVMSAMYGIANIGTMDSVKYLLGQVTPGKADFALMALERVRTPQGIEMIRAAGAGSKDADAISPAFRPALTRIAEAAGRS
ncbi:MAG: hypothetical protein ABI702_04300 [Burkholderiales bacterium]